MSNLLRIAGLLAVIVVTVAVALWAASAPADVSFRLPGWEGETSTVALGFAVALLGAVMALAWAALAWTFNLPGKLTRGARQSRINKARDALADGLMAAEGGDAALAAKQARRAAALTRMGSGDRRLALLLSARASEAGGDWIEAEKSYAELSREKGGELAGLRGLAAAAVKRGDHRGAEAHARAAYLLKSKADWPFGSLFELQTKAADWLGAADTLADGQKRGLIDSVVACRRRAVLLTAEASRLRRNDPSTAESLASEAAKLSAGFPPAALLAGRLQLASGRPAKAQATIEAAWRARPHPILSLLWSDLKPGEGPAEHARRILQLAAQNPQHRESRILVGESAIARGAWSEAAESLTPILEEGITGRLCSLMEAVARGKGDPSEAARWGRLAASAAREPDWSDIDPEGKAFDFSDADWARLVYTYGDGGTLIHPRYETYGRELETLSRLALPAPSAAGPASSAASPRSAAEPASPTALPKPRADKPPAPDYVPDDD